MLNCQMYKTALSLCLALGAPLIFSGCGKPEASTAGPAKTDVIREVSGRTDLGVGMSLVLPEGWVEEKVGGRPFKAYFQNDREQLAIGCAEYSNEANQAVTTLGDQIKRRLGNEGQVLESGPAKFDGTPGYKVLATQRTPSGHGLVVGIVVLRDTGRASTIYLFSAGDEKRTHRNEMDHLLESLEVD